MRHRGIALILLLPPKKGSNQYGTFAAPAVTPDQDNAHG
jgi:hypothetical protein